MWDQVTFEDQLIPSNEALYRHYLRSSWVIDYWRKASNNNMQLLPVISFGWKLNKEVLQIEWDSDENIQTIKEHVTFLLRGCKCTKSKCSTRVCSCRKAGRPCGPGCSCTGCTNISTQGTVKFILLALSQTSTQYSTHSYRCAHLVSCPALSMQKVYKMGLGTRLGYIHTHMPSSPPLSQHTYETYSSLF